MVMNADGSNQTNLTANFGEYSYPAWSPDGQRLAMRIDFGTGSGIAIMDLQSAGANLSGNQPVAIFNEFSDAPDWSPDGNQLVFMASGSPGWVINRYAVDSTNLSQIPGIPYWLRDPKWSPDGQKILFGADADNNGNSDIYVVNVDGSGLTQLTNNDYYEGSPNWSPDGQKIVFSADANDNQDLFIMDLDGSGLTQLTSDPADEFDASWSPDGTRIAFTSTRNDSNYGNNYEIYVINVDGSAEMRLTYNQVNDRWPDWRPGSTATGQQACQSQAAYSADVTIPAGTRFATPTSFTKIWRLENTGQCTFTPNAFRLRFVGGDLMSSPVSVYMPGAIQPGSSVDISAQFTSPSDPGFYTSNWQLLDASGIPVPDSSGNPLTFTVNIEVLAGTAEVLPAPLFFLRGEKDAQQIWRLDRDGFTLTQLTQESAGVSSFEVNPLDNRLAYESNHQLILLDPLNNNRQVLVAGDENNSPYHPVFSDDGVFLAYGLGGIHTYNLTSGEDRLVIASNDVMDPSNRRIYTPRSWSPDGSKLAVTIGYWEWGGDGIVSISDGSLLSEFEYSDSSAWSTDSQTFFTANATEPGMMSSTPGLFSISATLNATPQTLISDSFVWWPVQTAEGRLLFFQGTPDPTNPAQYNISLMEPSPDAIGQWQVLRENILHLTADGFPEAIWSPDGNFIVARLFHLPGKISEVVMLGLQETPMLYLMQDGTNLRFGK
jgi:Tol biopolymer transport system component